MSTSEGRLRRAKRDNVATATACASSHPFGKPTQATPLIAGFLPARAANRPGKRRSSQHRQGEKRFSGFITPFCY
ncbi:hypothetical protein ACQV2C_21435 [Pantoea allii]|uniref:hypothetical protein n=1 Tax=Pantoea allii TaxID=574096 RepID=UPI003D312CE9